MKIGELRKLYNSKKANCTKCGCELCDDSEAGLGEFFVLSKDGKFYCINCDESINDNNIFEPSFYEKYSDQLDIAVADVLEYGSNTLFVSICGYPLTTKAFMLIDGKFENITNVLNSKYDKTIILTENVGDNILDLMSNSKTFEEKCKIWDKLPEWMKEYYCIRVCHDGIFFNIESFQYKTLRTTKEEE